MTTTTTTEPPSPPRWWRRICRCIILILILAVVDRSTRIPSLSRRLADDQNLDDPLTSSPEIDPSFGRLEPLWGCQSLSRNRKLLFVHIFKTAGSTLRSLLALYSHHCRAGLALVVECTSLDFGALEQRQVWRNGGEGRRAGRNCKVRHAYSRKQELLRPNYFDTTFLEQNSIDILGGHIPLGSEYGWRDELGNPVPVQALAFFRDPVRKYISGVLYLKPDKSMKQVVNIIRQRVLDGRRKGEYYERYSSYLLTPQQVDYFQRNQRHLHVEERIHLSMRNLLDYNVAIGIVENMSQSLELLRFLVDAEDELRILFEKFGMNSNSTETVFNKSRLSTSQVLKELEKDSHFMQELREYLKFEEKIYTFALELHTRQYKHFLQATKRADKRLLHTLHDI